MQRYNANGQNKDIRLEYENGRNKDVCIVKLWQEIAYSNSLTYSATEYDAWLACDVFASL